MASDKKIGLITCTGIVAGNMMCSGIALLPANLSAIGSITLIGWLIALLGALGLAWVYAYQATTDPQEGGPIAYAGELSKVFGFQTGVLYYHSNWIGNLACGITAVAYLSYFPGITESAKCGIRLHRHCLAPYLCQYAGRQMDRTIHHDRVDRCFDPRRWYSSCRLVLVRPANLRG